MRPRKTFSLTTLPDGDGRENISVAVVLIVTFMEERTKCLGVETAVGCGNVVRTPRALRTAGNDYRGKPELYICGGGQRSDSTTGLID